MRFQLELQLAREWMSDQSDHVRGATLDLIATVAHHGKTMQSGHYTVRPCVKLRVHSSLLQVRGACVCCGRCHATVSCLRDHAVHRAALWRTP